MTIVRDPRAWIASWLCKGDHHDERDIIGRYGARRLSPETLHDPVARHWSVMQPFEKLCWEWNYVSGKLVTFSRGDDLSVFYRFEDLFSGERRAATFCELLAFISQHDGRQYPFTFDERLLNERVNASDDARVDQRTHWSEAKKEALHRMCGALMTELGYAMEDAPVGERVA